MAPLEIMNLNSATSRDNDDAFLTLLSSQRELLQRLNLESAMRRGQQQISTSAAQSSKRKRACNTVGQLDALSLMNTPIGPPPNDRGGNIDILFSRRLSGFAGNDFNSFPGFIQSFHQFEAKQKELNYDPRIMKRRRSSFGMLNSEILDDQKISNRRLSLISTMSGASFGMAESFDKDFIFDIPDTSDLPEENVVRLDPNIPQEAVRKNLSAFATSMDMSTKSQQDIHAWDRKMGLKRSHSKTMRMTMRSRKKLRAMLKKDINSVAQNH